VPISRLADCLLDSVAKADASGVPTFWSGTPATAPFTSLRDPKQGRRGPEPQARGPLAAPGRHLDGKHGVGLHEMGFLVDEAGAGGVDMMRIIKRAMDPKNILKPGKNFSL
jgi:D-lactate dehydrogenase (cytochrome)